MMKNIVFLLIVAFILTGCGNTTLDTSSEAKFKASVETLVKEISDSEKETLRNSFAVIISGGEITSLTSDVRVSDLYALGEQRIKWGNPLFSSRLKGIDGYTAKDINEHAAVVLKEYEERERKAEISRLQKRLTEYKSELAELQKCNAAREQAKEILPLLVVKSEYYLNELMDTLGRPMGRIESADVTAVVQNDSSYDVSFIQFRFAIKSGERQVYLDKKISFAPSIKSGESKTVEQKMGIEYDCLKFNPKQVKVTVTPIKSETTESALFASKHFYKTESEYLGLIRDVEGRIGALDATKTVSEGNSHNEKIQQSRSENDQIVNG
ncbi:hypothetical protein SAMN05660337_1228 [Maridesulfovibrio ferrireducens]|uniref:LPP20 lipoprotein n=1 Tax=Maridesulfovibrio ferrireducens TaxID=246191 RepID=A0A1G9ER39_9BACT|nr:DUF6694 family lipoprotein [Maridesulfovibrio ferrireducens]SDK78511.1 hypothetical protein SAMN05660337_1228 [Maridesulfovibrio ferrireducens]